MVTKTDTAHYTNFGVSMQPSAADQEGFLHFRPGYRERLAEAEWTDAEKWIAEQCDRIEEFQSRG